MSSWGRLSAKPHHVIGLRDCVHAVSTVSSSQGRGLAYGMGRSYGDVCLNPEGVLWQTTGLDHFIAFNEQTGRLVCEAGVLLRDIQRWSVPRGWILPVTPGTQLVTVGGAIANDVHGKNHHAQGTFGDHVHRIRMVRTDGELIECGPSLQPDWFAATVGGLGLTGVIVEAELQLLPVPGPWLDTETLAYGNLDEFFQLSAMSERGWAHTVSWIDCTSRQGRGLFMRGNPVDAGPLPLPGARRLSMPLVPPISLVNDWTLRAFNNAYFHLKRMRRSRANTHFEAFLYPLDNVLHWNRMYGPKGFYQYQSVIPPEVGRDATQAMLKEIWRSKAGSFLAVLKTFGHRSSPGLLGFARPGVTLALDFANQPEKTDPLFARLDAIVREAGGSIYAAKDARMSKAMFEAGYPRLLDFMPYRDPGISSGMSRRLMGW